MEKDSSSNQTQTSVAIPSTMQYLRRRPDLLLKLFRPQPQEESESAVSTELTHSCSFNSDRQRHKSYAFSNKRNNSCQNPPTTPNKRMRGSGRDREDMHWGYSIKLKLYDDLWKIKKCLTESDVGKLSRLFLATDFVRNLLLPVLGIDAQRDIVMLGERICVKIWDMDTESMHSLILKNWVSSKTYIILGSWKRDFVRRRNLKKEDVIGFHWDSYKHHFNFSVLKRGNC